MLTSDFDYNLPKELIAQTPAEPRDSARLMVVNREKKTVAHRHFFDLSEFLRQGDLLVWNNTKVFKARLRGIIELDEEVAGLKNKNSTDIVLNAPRVEIFLIKPMENLGVWKVLAKPAKKLRLGMRIRFAEDFAAEVIAGVPTQGLPTGQAGRDARFSNQIEDLEKIGKKDGTLLVQFNEDDVSVRAKANKYGEVPTPPYIKAQSSQLSVNSLEDRYQTVYAKNEGSVAAPTAGFHFTPELIEKLKNKGVEFAEITLHVGLGTFLPVKTDKIEEHKMHSEWVEITDKNAHLINEAKAAGRPACRTGRRVVAVGTTTVRALEGAIKKQETNELKPYSGEINIFITPGFKFKIVDALITNFHLPKSTLLMLVSAFAGDKDFILKCYEEAIKEKYRFFSFGDAMLIAQ